MFVRFFCYYRQDAYESVMKIPMIIYHVQSGLGARSNFSDKGLHLTRQVALAVSWAVRCLLVYSLSPGLFAVSWAIRCLLGYSLSPGLFAASWTVRCLLGYSLSPGMFVSPEKVHIFPFSLLVICYVFPLVVATHPDTP